MKRHISMQHIRQQGQIIFHLLEARTLSLAVELQKLPAIRNLASIESDLQTLQQLRLRLQKTLRDFKAEQKNQKAIQKQLPLHSRLQLQEAAKFFHALQRQNLRWPHVILAIKQQLGFGARPLYTEKTTITDSQHQQTGALDAVFIALHKLANPQDQSSEAKVLGCHSDIPLFPSVFVEDAQAAFRVWRAQKQPRAARFLDIGCGGGVKLLLAAQFFESVQGLEYDQGYVNAATALQHQIAKDPAPVFQADALMFDRYQDYDILYFYQPMQDSDGLIALENRIAEMSRPGCILMAPYPHFGERAAHLGCAHLAGNIYLAKTTPQQAAVLRQEAEQMGFVPAPYSMEKTHSTNFWQPIIHASHANGFAIY